jgi:Flp pilus assembly protein TadD
VDKGVALELLGRHTDAQDLYRQALAVSPIDVSIRNDLALSLMLQGRRQEAQAVLQEIGETDDAPARYEPTLGSCTRPMVKSAGRRRSPTATSTRMT